MKASSAKRVPVIIILGPQGSGKGTQAELLAKRRKFVYLSTGEVLRQAVSSGSSLGKRVQRSMKTGELLPDAVVNRLVAQALARPAAQRYGVVLDGYPRNQSQAEFLERHGEVTDVISLTLTDREAVRRLGGRRVCSGCGRGYHAMHKPPQRAGVCDACGGKLITRPDDRPVAIKNRLKIFRRQTQPLVKRYRSRGLVHPINAAPPIAQVFRQVVSVLKRKT